MVKIMEKFKLPSPNTINQPKQNAQYNLVTRTSGDGEIDKQLDYLPISEDMETWTDYTKV